MPAKKTRLGEDQYLTEDEYRRLRRAVEDAETVSLARGTRLGVIERAVIEILLYTGVRVSEAGNLKVGDIDFKRTDSSRETRKSEGRD